MTKEQYVETLKAGGLLVENGAVFMQNHGRIAPSFNLEMCYNHLFAPEDIKEKLSRDDLPEHINPFVDEILSGPINPVWTLRGNVTNPQIISRDFFGMNMVPACKKGGFSVSVSENLLNKWEMTVEDLLPIIPIKQDWQIMDMKDILKMHQVPLDFEVEQMKMLIITNPQCVDGAAVLLDTEFLESVRKDIGDFVILPSSRHEIIVVPMSECADFAAYRSMVHEVNKAEVEPQDFLSDDVFIFTEKGLQITD